MFLLKRLLYTSWLTKAIDFGHDFRSVYQAWDSVTRMLAFSLSLSISVSLARSLAC